MISILVLTRNEQQNLPECLASVAWSDDIHVLDSMSTDGTVQIAHQLGATVTQRVFDNWAAHQNWALANLPFRHPWVFYLDADERVTSALRDSALAAVRSGATHVAYRVHRRDFLNGRWLQHVQMSPFYMRLFRPEKMRYERLVNPLSIPDGSVGQLAGYLDHFPFSKGMGEWVTRHESYSTLEAQQAVARQRATGEVPSLRTALLARDFHQKRAAQKAIFYMLPFRPALKWFYLMVIRRGVLDGRAGLTYAGLQARYEAMIVRKTRELKAGTRNITG